MSHRILFFIFCLLPFGALAQAPQAFNYQAVARDASGAALINQTLNVRLSVISGTIGGSPVYQETHAGVSTNPFGLFTLEAGSGLPVVGTFSGINWASGAKFFKVEVDFGAGYVDMGTSQLLSVPYALFAAQSQNDSDNQTLSINGNQLAISNGNSVTLPGGTGGDNWGTQTAATNATLTGTGTSASPLGIAQQGATSGQVLKWNGSTWAPANDIGGGTGDNWGTQTVVSNATLTGTGVTGNALGLAQQGATSGQVLKWNGTTWAPAADTNTDAQTLTLSGTTLSISGGNNVTLPSGTAYTAGSGITISGNTIAAVDNSATNELQTISKTGSTITLSNSGGSVTDSDNQTLSVSGSTLSISGGNSVTLPAGTAYTAGSGITISGNTISAVDNSSTNEIQTLSISGSTLSISGTGGNSVTLPSGSAGWQLTGNAGTTTSNFIGTTDNAPLEFRVNNQRAGYLGTNATTQNTAFGLTAFLSGTGTKNTAIGGMAMSYGNTGMANTAVGHSSLYNNGSGEHNTALGAHAMYANGSGKFNTGVGAYAMSNVNSGDYNTAVGYHTLRYNSGSGNTGVGAMALNANTTGPRNTAVGDSAMLFNTTGANNAAVGSYALMNNVAGSANAAFGSNSLLVNTSGVCNTSIGAASMTANSTGNNNSAVGFWSLYFSNSDDNAALGYSAGDYQTFTLSSFFGARAYNNVSGLTNVTVLGYDARGTASNQVRIGNTAVTSIGGYAGWTNLSDGRYKRNVNENVPGLAFINKLTPVTYTLDMKALNATLNDGIVGPDGRRPQQANAEMQAAAAEKAQVTYTGFIAQDVERAAQETGFEFSGVDAPKNDTDMYGLRYAEFVVPLVKAVQELSEQAEQQQALIEQLRQQNQLLLQRVEQLER